MVFTEVINFLFLKLMDCVCIEDEGGWGKYEEFNCCVNVCFELFNIGLCGIVLGIFVFFLLEGWCAVFGGWYCILWFVDFMVDIKFCVDEGLGIVDICDINLIDDLGVGELIRLFSEWKVGGRGGVLFWLIGYNCVLFELTGC